MSLTKEQLVNSLSNSLPQELLEGLVSEYEKIKNQFFLGKFQPTELNAARFCEYVLRLLEHVDNPPYTPLGQSLATEKIINRIQNNSSLSETLRFFIPKQVRVLLDVRNRRDVAHVGGDVNPNYSDSLFVVHCCDWILTELVRHFYACSIDKAREIVANINEVRIPIVAEFDGFVRVLAPLEHDKKTLVILYHKHPNKVLYKDLFDWTEHTHTTRFRDNIVKKLHKDNLVHYMNETVELTPLGIAFVEKNIELSTLVV